MAGELFGVKDDKFMAEAEGDMMIDIPDPLDNPALRGSIEAGTQKYLKDVAALGLDA